MTTQLLNFYPHDPIEEATGLSLGFWMFLIIVSLVFVALAIYCLFRTDTAFSEKQEKRIREIVKEENSVDANCKEK